MAGSDTVPGLAMRLQQDNGFTPKEDTYLLGPGFYLYYHNRNVYDQFWPPPVRGPTFHDGVLYWRSIDGAIETLAPNQP